MWSGTATAMRRWAALVACAVVLAGWGGRPAPSAAQSVQVDAHVSADSVLIGERFVLSLVARHRASTEVVFPEPAAGPLAFGDLEVVARLDAKQRYGGTAQPGLRVDSVTYAVTTFALDSARVAGVPVQVVSGPGDTTEVRSPGLTVPVRSVVGPDAEGLRGLAPLATFPAPYWPWVLLASVALLLAAGLAYYAWQRRTADTDTHPPAPEPPVPPPVRARAQLGTLEGRVDAEEPDAVKAFYVDLADVLRRYLAARLPVAVMERTTSELVRALRTETDLPRQTIGRVHAVLELADLVKFAVTRPVPSDNQTALHETRAAIDAVEEALSADEDAAPSGPEAANGADTTDKEPPSAPEDASTSENASAAAAPSGDERPRTAADPSSE
jgi:hypothetical protein